MEKQITNSWKSYCEITLTVWQKEYDELEKQIIKVLSKDVKIHGFRKWHVPEHLVRNQLNPEYVKIWTFEKIINNWLHKLIEENPEMKFIWEPYDLDQKEEWEDKTIIFKLDLYPESEPKNDNRKKSKLTEIEIKVDEKEVEDAIKNLQKHYAEYIDSDEITEDSVSKVSMLFLDKDWETKDKWHIYVWEPEFEEFDFFKKTFIWKKKNETFEVKYDDSKLPPTVKYNKEDVKEVKNIRFVIKDIKKIVLPEINEETIKKLFGEDSKVKNIEELKKYIEENIWQQKTETELVKKVEEYIKDVKEKSFEIVIPNTIINEEYKTRLKNLEKRFWGKEKVEEYFKKLWEQQKKAFLSDIKNAAKDSLEKFFILQKVVELLEIEMNWDKSWHLEAEHKIYEKLTWKKLSQNSTQ